VKFTFKQLEYFVAAAEAGSITAAAERIHISPPSISTAISQLEQELGVDLFLRQRTQGLSLTSAGKKVLAHANTILQLTLELHDVASTEATALKGKISIGCLTTLAPLVVPELCHAFTQSNPGVEIALSEGSQDQLISQTRRGHVDVSITYEMHIPSDVDFEPLVELPPFLMVGKDHPLADARTIDLRDVADDPYVLLDLPYSRDYFLSIFQAVDLEPNIATRTSHMEVVRTMVANGYGVSIAVSRPRNQAALDGRPIISIPISNPVPKLKIGLLCPRRGEMRLIAAFKAHCRTMIGAAGIPGMSQLEGPAFAHPGPR